MAGVGRVSRRALCARARGDSRLAVVHSHAAGRALLHPFQGRAIAYGAAAARPLAVCGGSIIAGASSIFWRRLARIYAAADGRPDPDSVESSPGANAAGKFIRAHFGRPATSSFLSLTRGKRTLPFTVQVSVLDPSRSIAAHNLILRTKLRRDFIALFGLRSRLSIMVTRTQTLA